MFSFNPTDTDTNPNQESNPFKRLTATVYSYDGNVMLAAFISLLLVIFFVLLLHVYAKWFLSQAYHPRRRGSIAGVSRRVLGPTTSRFQHFHTFTLDPTTNSLTTPNNKGLDLATISAIPLFVYKSQQDCHKECVICLSLFEDEEVGRKLPKCGHCFHVECIDMWLHSHISCPICRALVDQAKTETSPQLVIEVSNSAEEAVVVMEVSDFGYDTHHDFVAEGSGDSVTDESSSSPLMMGCSLKRMLSRNMTEGKVFPSSNGNDASV